LHGEARIAALGSVSRAPAPEIEQAVISALQKYLAENRLDKGISDEQLRFDRAALAELVFRIEVQRNQLPHLDEVDERRHGV
jgi:hypothetical protein